MTENDIKLSLSGKIALLNHIPKWRFIKRYRAMTIILKKYGLK